MNEIWVWEPFAQRHISLAEVVDRALRELAEKEERGGSSGPLTLEIVQGILNSFQDEQPQGGSDG